MYASQNFDFFESGSRDFPYESHRKNLQNVLRIDARTVAPAAAGFRFGGDHAWLNSFVFPISRERFVEDLERLNFSGRVQVIDPGDRFEIDNGAVTHHARASDVAETLEDDTAQIRFDPTAPIPALHDPNPDGYGRAKLGRSVKTFIAGLAAYARAGYQLPVLQ